MKTIKIDIDLSPNFTKKTRKNKDIKFVIIHYTGMQSEIESLKRLKSHTSKVSCHYLINRKGRIAQLIKDKNVAWHAGTSFWKGERMLNNNSIGIELDNIGHGLHYKIFSNRQQLFAIIFSQYSKQSNWSKNSEIQLCLLLKPIAH